MDIPAPTEKDIKLLCPEGKVGWLFRDKSEWIRRLGYEPNEKFVDYVKMKIGKSVDISEIEKELASYDKKLKVLERNE